MRTILIGLVALTLSGCGESDAERSGRHDLECQQWGAKPGTAEYIQCRATLAKNDELQDRDSDQQAATAAMIGFASSMAASSSSRR